MKKFKKKKDIIRFKGIVKKNLSSNKYEVIINNKKCITYICGNMLKNNIKIMPDDEVIVEFNKNYLDKGRIVFRN